MDQQEIESKSSEMISVLIIKSSVQAMGSAEAYLKNRQWEVGTAMAMKEALTYIIQKKPQIVLIDVDHPNKKMKMLPSILAQAFPVKIIVYAEFDSPSAREILREMNQIYSLFPPVSGPAIERMILKIRKEKGDGDKQTMRIKGDAVKSARAALIELANSQETGGPGNPKIVQEGQGPGKKFSLVQEGPGSGVFNTGIPQPAQAELSLNRGAFYVRGEKKDSHHRESIVVRGAVEALDSTTVSGAESANGKIEKASNVACITVESPRFSGYLVTAMGKNRKIDQAFIETLKHRLFLFLKSNGETPSEEDALGIKINEVEFEDWALEQAEFLRKSIHHGDEVAMAFFPFTEVAVKFENSVDEKMMKISLNEFQDDVTVDFDLFIYLPVNNKYLLYTPQGETFKKEQKGRLAEKGVTHMHLKKENLTEVKKYRAQNYLNGKIEGFHTKRRQKGKS